MGMDWFGCMACNLAGCFCSVRITTSKHKELNNVQLFMFKQVGYFIGTIGCMCRPESQSSDPDSYRNIGILSVPCASARNQLLL